MGNITQLIVITTTEIQAELNRQYIKLLFHLLSQNRVASVTQMLRELLLPRYGIWHVESGILKLQMLEKFHIQRKQPTKLRQR